MKLMAVRAQSYIYQENINYYYFCKIAVRLLNKILLFGNPA